MEIPASLLMSSGTYAYVAVKASLHAADSAVFGLGEEETVALVKRFENYKKDVINGILLKASPIQVINALGQLGYRVVCTTGEAEVVWTLQRPAHMCDCGHAHPAPASQSLAEVEFERGLWFAAQYGDMERAVHLLNKGFYVDERDAAGYTSLHYAARNGHLDLCKLLLDRGACVNAVTEQGRATPLHRAATVGKLEIVKFLVERKGNCNLKDADGKNALHRAAANGHVSVCEYLVGVDATLKNERDMHGKKPADYGGPKLLTLLS